MPCDTRMFSTVEFKATMFNVVEKAMTDLGWEVTVNKDGVIRFYVDGIRGTLRDGKITFEGGYGIERLAAEKTTQLKRAYAKRITKIAAKKYGFEVKTVKEGHYQLVRE